MNFAKTLVLLVTLVLGALAQAPVVPDQFSVNERILSVMTTLDLDGPSGSFGTVTKRFFSVADQFDWTAPSGATVATGRKRLLSWGNIVEVFDGSGHKIGTIKEEILKSLFKVYTTYWILDANDRPVARSEKVDWLGTEITMFDGGGHRVVRLSRPWINLLGDKWEVQVANQKVVDPRLIVMTSVFKTDADNQRREAENRRREKD